MTTIDLTTLDLAQLDALRNSTRAYADVIQGRIDIAIDLLNTEVVTIEDFNASMERFNRSMDGALDRLRKIERQMERVIEQLNEDAMLAPSDLGDTPGDIPEPDDGYDAYMASAAENFGHPGAL